MMYYYTCTCSACIREMDFVHVQMYVTTITGYVHALYCYVTNYHHVRVVRSFPVTKRPHEFKAKSVN